MIIYCAEVDEIVVLSGLSLFNPKYQLMGDDQFSIDDEWFMSLAWEVIGFV